MLVQTIYRIVDHLDADEVLHGLLREITEELEERDFQKEMQNLKTFAERSQGNSKVFGIR